MRAIFLNLNKLLPDRLFFAACCYILLLQALLFSSRLVEPPIDHGFSGVEDSVDEDFGGILFIKLIAYFSGRS